jgi:hypothetical protein
LDEAEFRFDKHSRMIAQEGSRTQGLVNRVKLSPSGPSWLFMSSGHDENRDSSIDFIALWSSLVYRMNRRFAISFLVLVVACTGVLWQTADVHASGSTWNGAESDLQVSVDFRWAGCRIGGYFPIRIRMTNRGPTRTVTTTFDSAASGLAMPTVTRTVKVNQNATASFSLLIPMVTAHNYGSLTFSDESGDLETLTPTIGLPDVDMNNTSPSLLVIANQLVDSTSFGAAVVQKFGTSRSHRSSPSSDFEIIPPSFLPVTWLAYSGLDIVAIEKASLELITNDNRSALVKWVHAGGSLIVYKVGIDPSDRDAVDKLLELDDALYTRGWKPADLDQRANAHIAAVPNQEQTDIGAAIREEAGLEPAQHVNQIMPGAFRWNADSFSIRNVALGRVIAFQEQPFEGTTNDWAWLFSSIDPTLQQLRQAYRLGVAGRGDNKDFLQFVIPGIRSVPPIAFLIFISIFTFLIGPLNYFLLARRNRLNLLVITIPVVAIATSVCLFGYSAVAHGFGIKSRLRSITFLDQGTQTAVVSTRMSLYAGSAPSAGLSFSTDTSVIPIRAKQTTFEYGSVDWTKEQALRSGWLRSRTRTQFLTTTVRPERGRLTIKSNEKSADIKNGLEWDIDGMMIVDDVGNKFFVENIPAGEAGTADRLSKKTASRFHKLLARSRPKDPEDLEHLHDAEMFNSFSPRARYYYRQQSEFHASSGWLELLILGLTNYLYQYPVNNTDFATRTYWALVKKNPSIEMGVESVDIVDEWHIVIGHY